MALAQITSINQIMEILDPEFSWSVSNDKSEATMSFIARSDMTGNCDDRLKLRSGYTEDGGFKITLDNVHDVLQLILPLSASDAVHTGFNNPQLVRQNPMKFPYRGQEYDGAVNYDCYQLYAKTAHVHGHGTKEYIAAPYTTAYGRSNSPNYKRREYYTFDVDFAAIDYELKEDSAVTHFTSANGKDCWQEWERNTRIRFQPFLDVLTLDRGQAEFQENPDPAISTATVLHSVFPAPFKLNERKGILYVSWLDVPADYVLNTTPGTATYRQPVQFTNALGTVNDAEFLGCGKETLLLREMPDFVSKPFGAYYRPYRKMYHFDFQYDIHMKFSYSNPRKGKAAGAHSGHNIFPPKGQSYYLYASRVALDKAPGNPNNAIVDDPLFSLTDFRLIFQKAGTT